MLVYSLKGHEHLDGYLKVQSSSLLCLNLADLHTAFGFTIALKGNTFIEKNLLPWIELKEVGEVADFRGGNSFRYWFNQELAIVLRQLWPLTH